jgi:hypothetical protein
VATDIPSGSTPATGDAVLGSPNAVQSHDLNQTHDEPEFPAVISTPLTGVGTHFSTVDLCSDAAVNATEKVNDDRANFFRAMCHELPRNASLPLPISAQDILELHQNVWFWGPDGKCKRSCAFPWTQEPAQKILEAYLAQLPAEQPVPKQTRKPAKKGAVNRSRRKAKNVAAGLFGETDSRRA